MKVAVFVKILILLSCFQVFAIKPDRVYHSRPSDLDMKYNEYKVRTPDGLNLHVWDITSTSLSKREITIILCAGDSGNMGYYLQQANILQQNGFDVVLFDYRGFGESGDFEIDSTLLFHNEFLTDYEAILKDVKNKKNGKIGVWGFSMGGYFPIALAQKPDFIILDSAMLNLKEILSRLNRPNLRLPSNFLEIPSNDIPTVAFWGQKDRITLSSDNLLSDRSQINIQYCGGHMQLFQSMESMQVIQIIELFALATYESK